MKASVDSDLPWYLEELIDIPEEDESVIKDETQMPSLNGVDRSVVGVLDYDVDNIPEYARQLNANLFQGSEEDLRKLGVPRG